MGQRLDGAENTRSMLLCAELVRRGHHVTMWTSAYDHIRKEWRREWLEHPEGFEVDGLHVRFMKGCGYRTNVSLRRFADHYLAARDFARLAPSAPRPDAIIASLPDHFTADAAIAFANRHRIPTILDIRDKWPDVFVDRVGTSPLAALANFALLPEHRRTRRAVRGASAVVAVMQSLLEWGLKKGRRVATQHERVFYLTTSPRNFDVQRPPVVDATMEEVLGRIRGRTVFAFVGTFNQTQHPSLILDAIDILAAEGRFDPSTSALVIAGDGNDAEEVRRRAARYPNVHYVGWVNARQMSALLGASDVGILAMNFASPAFNNKAFAYLASGLPIINGATGDLADMVSSERAGINVRAGDARALADAIAQLSQQPALRAEFTRNVRRLFLERFDREANYRAYADHVEAVAKERIA